VPGRWWEDRGRVVTMTMVPAPDLMYQCLPSIAHSDMHGAGEPVPTGGGPSSRAVAG